MQFYDTLRPYKTIPYRGIRYTVCRDYPHISRHRCLRQTVQSLNESSVFMALETPNPVVAENLPVKYHVVTAVEENRLDLIAHRELGNATYAWVIAYLNGIGDGFSVHEGQRLTVPTNITSLFNKGEMLASVSPSVLNLGTE